MKKATHLLVLLTLTSAMLFSGCNREDQETITFYEGPIPNWSDIAIPEGAEFRQDSVVAGPENHFFEVDGLSEAELFAFLEEAMGVNGWTIKASNSEIRQFIKDGNLVTYNSDGEVEGRLIFTVIIEPDGLYDN